MDYAVVVSAIVLGLSVLASIAKFLEWFMHSDPRTMVRTTRWMLLMLMLLAIAGLFIAIAREQWSLAMLSGAGTLILGTFLKWRSLLAPLRAILQQFRPRARPFDMKVWEDADDDEKVRRAAALLEAYVQRSSVPALADARKRADRAPLPTMSRTEALEVLGLADDADEAEIRAACLRLTALVHPDRGGSPWLVQQVEKARDTLLPSRHERRNVA
jgi:hypothetical protein